MIDIDKNSNGNIVLSSNSIDGGWEIHCLEDRHDPVFKVYEIPQYGGAPMFDIEVCTLKDAISHVKDYT